MSTLSVPVYSKKGVFSLDKDIKFHKQIEELVYSK